MSSENKMWDEAKSQYLHQVEKVLASVKSSRKKEVLDDVRSHLERRFAELQPEQQSWENIQKIITDMGPPTDYAELMDAKAKPKKEKLPLSFVGAAIIIFAILAGLMIIFTLIYHPEKEEYTLQESSVNALPHSFTNDPEILGEWESVDFVEFVNDFQPETRRWDGELFLKRIIFMAEGRTSKPWTWTKGWIYDNEDNIRAEYKIKEIAGHTYLFFPWLSGDVTIRGQKPSYYVLKKALSDTTSQKEDVQVEREITKGPEVNNGLGFLKGIPEFRDLRLNMTEHQLVQHCTQYSLAVDYQKSNDESTYHLYTETGENVIVMFHKGQCTGIQRMQPNSETAIKLFEEKQLNGPKQTTAEQIEVGSGQEMNGDNLIVPGQRVGDFNLGMSKDDVLKSLGKPKMIFHGEERYTLDNLPRTYFMVFDDISFGIVDDSVEGIGVLSPLYKFANGLGVGDSEQEFKQAFGNDFQLKETEWKDFLTYENEGLEFEIHKKNRTVMEFSVLKKVSDKDTVTFQTKQQKEEQNTEAAVDAAIGWLKIVDTADYDQSWEQAAEYLKRAVSKDQLRKSFEMVRRPLGKVISRRIKSKTYTKQAPGAPDGEYLIVQFETSFENKTSAVETITPMLDKDVIWRVSGYYIK
ncbi:DUF4019 domain-containing protein [Planctomycetota bacterium]